MSAFFFGPAERQLFGFYHAPRGEAKGAAVILPSWGPEYQYAHRALRVLARRLSERGVHVLRFDYSGVGDSWGDTSDATPERWQEDVGLAMDELSTMSNQQRVDLVGLRVGALLATSAALHRSDVNRLVLWDPIVDGTEWVRSLNAQRDYQVGSDAAPIEFAQRVVSPALIRYFRDISAAAYAEPAVESVLLLHTSGAAQDPHPLGARARTTYRHVPDAAPWQADTSIWTGLVPAKAVASIVDWMAAS